MTFFRERRLIETIPLCQLQSVQFKELTYLGNVVLSKIEEEITHEVTTLPRVNL